MGYRTTADEKIVEAKAHIQAALKSLNEIVVDKCSGYDNYNSAAYKKIKDTHRMLIDLNDELEDL